MAGFPRAELEEVVERWLQANRDAEQSGDWTVLADFYTSDATYGWNIGPKEDVMCVGIDEIRDIALGQEMEGLQGWRYPYQRVVIDDKQGEVVGFWKQIAGQPGEPPSDPELAVYGIGGSWFRYAGGGKWNWQRDFFDFGHVSALYVELLKTNKLPGFSQGMQKRIERSLGGDKVPGYYPLGQAPVQLW
ncbi:nuclear transport factor 2 family protein [Mycobacterium spongiae]|uniref:Nuclear transport factor 2 family protein n=1 Tax=Mycobacterium spongiae TaxID=886343 RepID=A0A975K0C1_9MYCO|nr:nuclear transport factor 2 family protein [Mycobacterium spongiae]QUR69036.1 nuclear transport factor 2 family protein [Mycobacterium spongiae]